MPPAQERPIPRPGWNKPKPEKTPAPTYWPFIFALGIMFLAWGIIANIFIVGMGLILFAIGLVGWIGDLLHEG